MASGEAATPAAPAVARAAGWRKRDPLALLRGLLQRETGVLLRRPRAIASHLHNMLLLEAGEGEAGAAAALLERARSALAGRAWLQLGRRPPLDRSVQWATLEHGATVWALAWSPDGGRLASAGADGAVRMWRPDQRRLVGTLEAGAGAANALAWSPDGELLAAGHDDGGVLLWHADDLRPRGGLAAGDGGVLALAWSPDGERLAVGYADGSVALWDPRTGARRAGAGRHDGRVHALAWSPGAATLASGGAGGEVWLWDRAAAAVRARLVDRRLRESLAKSLHGDASSAAVRQAAGVFALAWSPDGRTLAAARRIGAVSLWHPAAGEDASASVIAGAGVTAVAWSPDAALLAYASGEGSLALVEPEEGRSRTLPLGHDASAWSLAWAPQGDLLASGSEDGTVRLWRARGWWERAPAVAPETERHGTVFGVAWSEDGALLASGGADGAVCLWDTAEGTLEGLVRDLGGPVAALAPAPGRGMLLAPVALSTEVPVLAWAGPDSFPRPLLRVSGPVLALAASPDGSLLAAGDIAGTVWVHRLPSGGVSAALQPPRRAARAGSEPRPTPVWALSWSPDGRLLAAIGQLGCVIWDLATGAPRAELEGCGEGGEAADAGLGLGGEALEIGLVRAPLSWSPDGRLLATGRSTGGGIRLWEPERGEPVAELTGHERPVTALAWSPDGRLLASASQDLTVRVWEVAAGVCRASAWCLSSPCAVRFAAGGALQAADDGSATCNRPLFYHFALRGLAPSAPDPRGRKR